jgi:hypothetical protein
LIIFSLPLILASATDENRYRSVAADGLFLFAVKKKQKTSAENFSFEASAWAWAVEPDPDSYRDVRPISVERGYGAMA